MNEEDQTAGTPPTPPPDAPVLARAEASFDVAYVRRALDRVRRVAAPRGRIVSRVALYASAAALLSAWAFGGADNRPDYRSAATIMFVAVAGVPMFVRRMVALRIWRSEPQRDARVAYEFRDDGVCIRAPKNAALFPWESLAKAAKFDDGLVLMAAADGTGYFVPKEAFGTEAAFERATGLMRDRVATYRAFGRS